MKWLNDNWFKLAIVLFVLATFFWHLLMMWNIHKCLVLASRREIQGLPGYILGQKVEDYFANCYKMF